MCGCGEEAVTEGGDHKTSRGRMKERERERDENKKGNSQ